MSKIFSPEKKIVCLKDDISYKPNYCNKPIGKFSSAFLHSKFPSLFATHSSCPLLCRCVPADSKSKERCVKSPPCFQCYHGLCAVGFLHIYMCCVCDWFAQIVVEKSFLFFKNILERLILTGTHFPVFFCPISPPFYWQFSRISVIQELRAQKIA